MSEGYTDDQGVFHPFTGKSSKSVAGAAAAIVLAAVAGSGAGSAAAVGGAADEFSAGTRASQSQEADDFSLKTRSSRGQTEIRIKGSDDYIKATIRLRRLGQHNVRFESQPTTDDCASYSDGEIHTFLKEHKCVSLNRTFVEVGEKTYKIQFFIATIAMPDNITAEDLRALFSRDDTGHITPLFPKGGTYLHIPVTAAPPSQTTLHDDTVINIQGQGLSRTPSSALIASLATSVLFSLDTR